jgi:hypothetical protein
MGSSEHQISLSKGVIAKFVLRLELEARISTRQIRKPPVLVAFIAFQIL